WVAILNRRIDFNAYAHFINQTFCNPKNKASEALEELESDFATLETDRRFIMAMQRLRKPLEIKQDCLHVGHGLNAYELLKTATEVFLLLECGVFIAEYADGGISGADRVSPAGVSLGELQKALSDYLGDGRLPYIKRIVGANPTLVTSPYCEGFLK